MMSILFLPIENHTFKMTIKLHGILILDTTYIDVGILRENMTIPQY